MDNLDLIHNLHDIKILKGYYFSILDGSKTFEVRLDDRHYEVGDFIHFKPVLLSGEVQENYDDKIFQITYCFCLGALSYENKSSEFRNFVVFSIKERKDLCFDFKTKSHKLRKSC